MKNLLAAIQAIAPNAIASNNITSTRTQPDTIVEARAKVVAKLKANINFINAGMNTATSKKPDLTFKYNPRTDTYGVGAKYGNRWVDGLVDTGGEKYVQNVARSELVTALNLICDHVNDGDVDAGIMAIQKKALAARKI